MQIHHSPVLKKLFRLISGSSITVGLLTACIVLHTSFICKEEDKSFAPSISILGSDPATGELTLSDRGVTVAKRSQKVTWVIGPHSGVVSITGITVKEGSTNVFDPEPHQLGNSSNWQGTISAAVKPPAEELYSITWTDSAGTEHTFDPKIQVK